MDGDKALAQLCKRRFFRFFVEFWDEIVAEPLVPNWHIEYICDELQYLNSFVEKRLPKPDDLIINVPPGSTKSTIVSQMYTAWVWTRDPKQRHISASYSQMLSISHSTKTRDLILSDKYRRLFPEVVMKEDQGGKTDFWNTLGGQRFTTSVSGTIIGVHAHQQLVDDPLNAAESSSDSERLSANEFVTSTLSTRKVSKSMTPLILIMQRLHEDDPTGYLMAKVAGSKRKKVKLICLPAIAGRNVSPPELLEKYTSISDVEDIEEKFDEWEFDEESRKEYRGVKLLDPERINPAVLEEAKVDLGTYKYDGQFLQNPAPLEGGIIKKDWFPIVDWEEKMSRWVWHFLADTAYTEKEDNDPSGFMAYSKQKNEYYIRNFTSKYLEFPLLCKFLPQYTKDQGGSIRSLVEVEPKASGKSLVQTLKNQTKLNIKEGKPPAKDKTSRALDSSPVAEAGRVKIIKGSWNDEFLHQLATFPNASHDEAVDLLTMMIHKDKKGAKRKGRILNNR